jgi:deoxyhypusine synthase
MAKVRNSDEFRDGFEDGLEPLRPIDLRECKGFDDVLRAMAGCSFGARNLGEAADVLEAMIRDTSCFRVLTLSGALTVAKMQLVLDEMLDRGWFQAVVSTGALVCHGFVEGAGMAHFKYRQHMSDTKLYELGYDRVYDTLELEKNLNDASLLVEEIFGQPEYDGRALTSPEICAALGKHLVDHDIGGRSILKTAYRRGVPIYIPALSDSELGLDLISLRYRRQGGAAPVHIEHAAFGDVVHFAQTVQDKQRMGVFTLGGGVPRNWAQQLAPFLELKYDTMKAHTAAVLRYHYAVRVCPEPVHWGGLSGCTYSEGVSWGKFVPEGRFSEVYCDATIALPILVKTLMERLG